MACPLFSALSAILPNARWRKSAGPANRATVAFQRRPGAVCRGSLARFAGTAAQDSGFRGPSQGQGRHRPGRGGARLSGADAKCRRPDAYSHQRPVDVLPGRTQGPTGPARRSWSRRSRSSLRPGRMHSANEREGGSGWPADHCRRAAANSPVVSESGEQRLEIPPARSAPGRGRVLFEAGGSLTSILHSRICSTS